MAINKVVYGNQTLIDLTDSTLTSSDELVEGVIAYDRSGNRITGTADYMDKVDNPTADKILIDDGNGQAQDSSVSIIDVALMSDVNGKQDVLTAGTGIGISNNVITNEFDTLLSPDLDDIKYTFSGYVRTASNAPPGTNTNGYLQVIARKGNTSYTMQVYTPYNDNDTYIRLNNEGWGAWESIKLTAGNGINLSGNTISVYHTALDNVDLDTVLTEQLVYCRDSCTNKPTSNGGLLISTTSGMTSGGYGAQMFIPYSATGEGVYYRRRISSTWTTWTKLENEITSTSGAVTMNTSGLIASASVIKEGGWVYVQLNRTGTTQFTANTTQAVGTLPEGFRPSSSRNGMGLMTLNGIPTYWTITSGGVLSLRVATVPATNTATYMTFYFPL